MQHERPYEKMVVWREAHVLCLRVYELTKKFPPEERFRLVNQMCKSASSVPTNITEGNAKRSTKEKLHFFEIAEASLEELHYQCRLSLDLNYINPTSLLPASPSGYAGQVGASPDERPGVSYSSYEVDGLIPRSLLRKKESRACSGVHTSD